MATNGLHRPWFFASGTYHPTAAIIVDDGDALVGAVQAGLGATQLPSYMVEPLLESGELVEVLAHDRPKPDAIQAVHLGGKTLPARTRAYLEFLSTLEILPRV